MRPLMAVAVPFPCDGILFPAGVGATNRMFLTDRHGESMLQRVRQDEEINVCALSRASSISAKARPHTLKAIE